MHELPITRSLLNLTLRYASEHHAQRVTHLYLVLGSHSAIVEDSVQFYWELISRGTLAETAVLHFERVPGRMLCFDCSHMFYAEPDQLTCPACQSARVQAAVDDEIRLDAIDIETEP